MSRIVAGRFDRSLDADAALERLKRDGFARSEVDAFYVGPPGQNARLAIGGDAPSDAGSRGAGRSGMVGAVAGLAVGLIIGSLLRLHGGVPPRRARAPPRALRCGLIRPARAAPHPGAAR